MRGKKIKIKKYFLINILFILFFILFSNNKILAQTNTIDTSNWNWIDENQATVTPSATTEYEVGGYKPSDLQSKKTPDLNPLGQLQIKIPGIDELAEKYPIVCEDENDKESCKIPWIAIYIYAIYNYLLGIGGVLAAVALMIGGVIWLVSAGNASRVSQAKSWITGSVTGIFILLTSYVLLYQINPELVGMKYIKLQTIEEESGDGWENVLAGTAFTPENVKENAKVQNKSQCINMMECPTNNSLIKISSVPEITENITIKSGVDDRVIPGAIEALKKASQKAKEKNVKLIITSAFRSQKKQCELWFDLGQDTALVSKPGRCTSHMGGTTIDIGILNKNTFGSRHLRNDDTKLLYDIMVDSGWIRYCGEQWHFQYNDGQSYPCPGNVSNFGHCTIYKGGGKIEQAPNCSSSMFGKIR